LAQARVILEIAGPHFTVRLYESWLRIDLKGNTKNEIVEALENKPVLRQSIGNILEVFAPLHINLSDIDTVQLDNLGKVKLVLPLHRDVTIPLSVNDAKTLVDTMNPLIVKEKEKKAQRIIEEVKVARARAKYYIAITGVVAVLTGLLGYVLGAMHWHIVFPLTLLEWVQCMRSQVSARFVVFLSV